MKISKFNAISLAFKAIDKGDEKTSEVIMNAVSRSVNNEKPSAFSDFIQIPKSELKYFKKYSSHELIEDDV